MIARSSAFSESKKFLMDLNGVMFCMLRQRVYYIHQQFKGYPTHARDNYRISGCPSLWCPFKVLVVRVTMGHGIASFDASKYRPTQKYRFTLIPSIARCRVFTTQTYARQTAASFQLTLFRLSDDFFFLRGHS